MPETASRPRTTISRRRSPRRARRGGSRTSRRRRSGRRRRPRSRPSRRSTATRSGRRRRRRRRRPCRPCSRCRRGRRRSLGLRRSPRSGEAGLSLARPPQLPALASSAYTLPSYAPVYTVPPQRAGAPLTASPVSNDQSPRRLRVHGVQAPVEGPEVERALVEERRGLDGTGLEAPDLSPVLGVQRHHVPGGGLPSVPDGSGAAGRRPRRRRPGRPR